MLLHHTLRLLAIPIAAIVAWGCSTLRPNASPLQKVLIATSVLTALCIVYRRRESPVIVALICAALSFFVAGGATLPWDSGTIWGSDLVRRRAALAVAAGLANGFLAFTLTRWNLAAAGVKANRQTG